MGKSGEKIEQKLLQAEEEGQGRLMRLRKPRKRIQEAMGNGSAREAAVEEGNLVLDPEQEVATVALHNDGAK